MDTAPSYQHPNLEEVNKTYPYVGWHDQRLYEQYDYDREKNNPYEIFNMLVPLNELDQILLEQKEKNKQWFISQQT